MGQTPEEIQAHMGRWGAWMGKLGEQGKLEGGGKWTNGTDDWTDVLFFQKSAPVSADLMCLAEFLRCQSGGFGKEPVEISWVIEAQTISNFLDTLIGIE